MRFPPLVRRRPCARRCVQAEREAMWRQRGRGLGSRGLTGAHPVCPSVPTPMSCLPRLALLLTLVLAGCATHLAPPGPSVEAPRETADAFVMPDGMRLPYRVWLPQGAPRAVMLALHGMNDSRDGWEIPAPDFAAAGIAVFSPDQRGFGDRK